MKTIQKPKRILVQTINADQTTTFKKYPVDPNNKILISKGGGAGNKNVEPSLSPQSIFSKGIFRRPYVIYSFGAEEFVKRVDSELPTFSMKTVDDYFDDRIFEWLRTALTQKLSIPNILTLILTILTFLMVARGFNYINF